MLYIILSLILLIICIFLIIKLHEKRKLEIELQKKFPNKWKTILLSEVEFYRNLSEEDKKKFENRIKIFIFKYKINGIGIEIDILDKLLVASSAIIPVFSFPNWEYPNLEEVLLYPGRFNEDYSITDNAKISGMVGSGVMEGKMILSQPALRLGFKNNIDKKNVGIHEFVHLIDKADGIVDGIPNALMKKQYAIPWLKLVDNKMQEIRKGTTGINPYGAVSEIEFFSVLSEYFFENPKLLQKKQPEIYKYLKEFFMVDLATVEKKENKFQTLGRNSECPCGSGEKYKNCCLILD